MREQHQQAPFLLNRSMPTGTMIPVLGYPDVRQAVDWLCHCFGFVERLRIGEHRAQLSFGGGSVVITGLLPVDGHASIADREGHSVMVRVADADHHYQRARECGARIVSPLADYPYGERQYTVRDLGGYLWTFSQTVRDVDPSEWGGTLTSP